MKKVWLILYLLIWTVIIGIVLYYTGMNRLMKYVNKKYHDVPIVFSADKSSNKFLSITISELVHSGFPFVNEEFDITGLVISHNGSIIRYENPIKIGYVFKTNKFFISYEGDLSISSNKVLDNGVSDLIITAHDYNIEVDLPISVGLVIDLIKTRNPIEFINHIGKLNIDSGWVTAKDSKSKRRFFTKEHESLDIKIVNSRRYISFSDFLDHLPEEYVIEYDARNHKLYSSEYYELLKKHINIFAAVIPNKKMDAKIHVKFDESSMKRLDKKLNLKASGSFVSPYIQLLDYNIDHNIIYRDIDKTSIHKIVAATDLYIPKGFLTDILNDTDGALYKNIVKLGDKNGLVNYILDHRESLLLGELGSDNKIKLRLDAKLFNNNISINNISFDTESYKMSASSDISNIGGHLQTGGIINVSNYKYPVEFFSRYLSKLVISGISKNKFPHNFVDKYYDFSYEFVKKILSKNMKKLKNSFEIPYYIDFNSITNSKIGNIGFSELKNKYLSDINARFLKHGSSDFFKLKQKIKNKIDQITTKTLNHLMNINKN
ncbi:hypothetical protein [Rickettsia endosymbiont of Cardiosporidium cionae]|uniref:hypothetical protein n=1 Tax=Rickettsia endosymbiont of Cardiosporidium cionae TaxID=2777155 RepID=UPI001893364F|nr:hypothetical protein [Rickettsia endosymbiont of Cardiosporidium cionae]KAF8818336.1 hypothetical protein IHI24_000796 [Rickettsia endosymbiont of Cardiosporidium cionae]